MHTQRHRPDHQGARAPRRFSRVRKPGQQLVQYSGPYITWRPFLIRFINEVRPVATDSIDGAAIAHYGRPALSSAATLDS